MVFLGLNLGYSGVQYDSEDFESVGQRYGPSLITPECWLDYLLAEFSPLDHGFISGSVRLQCYHRRSNFTHNLTLTRLKLRILLCHVHLHPFVPDFLEQIIRPVLDSRVYKIAY